MIKIENLTKVYGEGESQVIALNNVSCDIEEGKFVAIIGKSGSGKSTLLNMIGALEKPTKGSVKIGDIDLNGMDKNKLAKWRNQNMGYIFQAFYVEPEFSVLDNVAIPLLIANVDKQEREQRATECIVQLGLEDKIKEKVKNLSGGQKQRVAIARALVSQPSIILADEPTGNLDTANGKEVMNILREIADSGKTVIMVTHNMNDAKMVDIVLEMQDGQIININ